MGCCDELVKLGSGNDGSDGSSSYTYIAFASDSSGADFTLDSDSIASPCYINFLVDLPGLTPVLLDFTTNGTGWVHICGADGSTTTSSTFTSGAGDPSTPGIKGDVYLNISNGVIFQYDGFTWNIVPLGYTITSWQNITPLSPYIANTIIPRYRQQGGMVVTTGSITCGTADYITSDVLLYTYPSGYRPISNKLLPVWDNYSGVWGLILVKTDGTSTIMGSKVPVWNTELYLDGIDFELV